MLDQTIFNQDNQIQSFDSNGNLILTGVYDYTVNRVVINEFVMSTEQHAINVGASSLLQFVDICKTKKIDSISFCVPNSPMEKQEQEAMAEVLQKSGFTISESEAILTGERQL